MIELLSGATNPDEAADLVTGKFHPGIVKMGTCFAVGVKVEFLDGTCFLEMHFGHFWVSDEAGRGFIDFAGMDTTKKVIGPQMSMEVFCGLNDCP